MAPAVKTVVVTGAGGFVGAELTKQLLDQGYTVRATVRSRKPEIVEPLEKLAAALPGKLEIVEGADLVVEGSFDKAVDGATYVFHVASPVTFGTGDEAEDQKYVVDPAVKGTLTVLQSAAKSKSVQRVVLTSSVAALTNAKRDPAPGSVYGPDDWNTESTVANGGAYAFSKVQAEKAAWEFSKEHGIDLVTILPSVIIGPVFSTRGGFSVDTVKALLEGGSFDDNIYVPQLVDVRDVARAHILAAETPSAHGRYILSHGETVSFKVLREALVAEFPEVAFGEASDNPSRPFYDSSKAEKELGLHLVPATDSFVTQARTLLSLGYAKPAFKN